MNYTEAVKNMGGEKRALIRTFGCQLNENDSEKIAGLLTEMGYTFTDDENAADFILFNTCAIRENAEKKLFGSVGVLKGLKAERPQMTIAVAGCMTGEPHVIERLKRTYKQVDIVLGANNIEELPRLLYTHLLEQQRVFDTEYDDKVVWEGAPTKRTSPWKAGVPVMYGCNNFCAYCIVPYVRGRERSREEADIVREVEALVADGCREVMLLGQNVNSYKGGGDAFAHLLEKVSDTGIARIRFMTSHPKDLSDSLIAVMASRDNICKQLHLPVQAGSNRVLAQMNRKYTREHYLDLVARVRAAMPDIALTSDIIVGFPGETTAEFEETLHLLEEVRFDMIYSFIFSPRRGTPAEKMPEVLTEAEKGENFARLIALQNQISLEKNQALTGKTLSVLVEGASKTDETMLTGRSDGGKLVHFKGDTALCGSLQKVRIQSAKTWNLIGEMLCH